MKLKNIFYQFLGAFIETNKTNFFGKRGSDSKSDLAKDVSSALWMLESILRSSSIIHEIKERSDEIFAAQQKNDKSIQFPYY